MNAKSRFDESDQELRAEKPRYMFLGYGGYNSRGGSPLVNGVGVIRSPGFFDPVFELLGLKKKSPRRSEGEN